MRRLLLDLSLVAGLLALPASAQARSEGRTLGYGRDLVWSTCVRFLVVDEHAKVTDKDADAGYVMFELREDDGKWYRGSLEIITVQNDRPSVKFAINIVDRPLWREAGMIERLEQKIRHELGSPPPPPKKDPPKEEPPKDGRDGKDGKDGGKDADKDKKDHQPPPARP